MTVIDKTVVSPVAPEKTNVRWVDVSDAENPSVKIFLNGEWKEEQKQSVPSSIVTTIDDWSGVEEEVDDFPDSSMLIFDNKMYTLCVPSSDMAGLVLSRDTDINVIYKCYVNYYAITKQGVLDSCDFIVYCFNVNNKAYRMRVTF